MDRHGAVHPEQFRGALQEAVAGVAGVTVDRQLVVGRVRHDGELAVLGVDLWERNAVIDRLQRKSDDLPFPLMTDISV